MSSSDGGGGGLAGGGSGGGGDSVHDQKNNDQLLLRSHVVPPSHILSDGRFIRLPPPTALEHSAFFERAVAAQRLISGDDDDAGKKRSKRRQKSNDANNNTDTDNTAKKAKKADEAFIHPLAIASARLRAKGSDELSKAINLGGLVMGGEYFGLTNVVNQRLNTNSTGASGAAGENGNDGGVKDASGTAIVDGESIALDQRLRSNYVLQRRLSQYDNASTVLSRHERRLSASLSVRRILDARLRTLRRRWRLVAPEHGTRTIGPVRPKEVVAIDVEIYDRDRLGGGNRAVDDPTGQTPKHLGRIARRVPRFATMELDDDYDVTENIQSLRRKIVDILQELKRDDEDNDMSAMKVESSGVKGHESLGICMTKAEPFAIADPTLGKIDPDFDPDKVPLLTLLFEIEKPTGFVQRASLSSSSFFKPDTHTSNNPQLHPDERVIEALQHSLFCASLFESMRAEIIPSSFNLVGSPVSSQKQHKPVVWLSSEMEESFLPSVSEMAGQDTVRSGETQMLCVIHCHEGEVKVQLDDEYSLTVKLIEAGTASAAGKSEENSSVGKSSKKLNGGGSGSQSPSQLKTLCRTLLLHSQSLYHDHCMKTRSTQTSTEDRVGNNPAVGFAMKKKSNSASPHILQSCVGLGCKLIFEGKVRRVLKRLSTWLSQEMKCEERIEVEWLPTTVFGSHSRFVILFRCLCLDVGVDADKVWVTQTSENGDYKSVKFGSDFELEYFLRRHLSIQLKNS